MRRNLGLELLGLAGGRGGDGLLFLAGLVEVFHDLQDLGLDVAALGLGALDLELQGFESFVGLDRVEFAPVLLGGLFLLGQLELFFLFLLLERQQTRLHVRRPWLSPLRSARADWR